MVDDSSSAVEPTRLYQTPTRTPEQMEGELRALARTFEDITGRERVDWRVHYHLIQQLGAGGQGVVFLADRIGAFQSMFRLALKFFRPENYADIEAFTDDMSRLARVVMHLARLQQDHLLDVYNVLELEGIPVLAMEWVDGYDLRYLLTPRTLDQFRAAVNQERWNYVNDVIVTRTAEQLRLKPGVAIAILRECLSGLGALHREGLVHSDIKPANIMVKRTGNCKIIDFGSAFLLEEPSDRPTWTPRYAAVEILEGERATGQSDLASLGYVLFEMLSGQFPFSDCDDGEELVAAKRRLPDQLPDLLPRDVGSNGMLLSLLRKLIAPDPSHRFLSAEDADLSEHGAAGFQRQLVKGNLASEYENDIRMWTQELD